MKAPAFSERSFNCPHCSALAQMSWANAHLPTPIRGQTVPTEYHFAQCAACGQPSIWHAKPTQLDGRVVLAAGPSDRMLWPNVSASMFPAPHPDLSDACKTDFMEAREVANVSPRAAAALLRLCIQRLCSELGRPERNINDAIAGLVKDGLPTRVQEALDIVRVIGNNAVHPGQMTTEDHAEQANALFELVNIIVEQMVAQPRRISAMYATLPDGARKAIESRDRN